MLAREFDDLAAERYIYAKKDAAEVVGLLALASMRLTSGIPDQHAGRGTNGFWEGQHTEWSRAHRVVSDELRAELFKERPGTKVGRKHGTADKRSQSKFASLIARLKGPIPRLLNTRATSTKSKKARLASVATPQPNPSAQHHQEEDLLTQNLKTGIDVLVICITRTKQFEEQGRTQRANLLRITADAVFRNMDLNAMLQLMSSLKGKSGHGASWQRQQLMRIINLIILENITHFPRQIDKDLRTVVEEIGGATHLAELDRLKEDLLVIERTHKFKLQHSRNTIVAQQHTSVEGYLETIKANSFEETERLGTRLIDWLTELYNLLAITVSADTRL